MLSKNLILCPRVDSDQCLPRKKKIMSPGQKFTYILRSPGEIRRKTWASSYLISTVQYSEPGLSSLYSQGRGTGILGANIE